MRKKENINEEEGKHQQGGLGTNQNIGNSETLMFF